MFLKSLTVRGFKSFADKTWLEFEPGVTVVVGPNGSGKSNLVDAVAWVLGAQGVRALRGGKMDDVIFAGTADRPALGRAEVSLTIDNTAGLLPIEFSEVTITRTLFRTGESEYQINASPCRLLDIQDLLSDTGIGRQQHVIVGQGQLDTVLNARSEDRRAIIEEAAGILKFRKRREKAERRLEATEANLLRLTDLLREVRRQLRPLERQADAARRHGGLASELRSIRLHLAGREVERLRARLERQRAGRADLAATEAEVRARLRVLDAQVLDAERALSGPGDDDVADMLVRVESLRERSRGLQALVAERLRGLERELAAVADEGVVETLVADAAALRDELVAVADEAASLTPRRTAAEEAEHRAARLEEALQAEIALPADETPEGRVRGAAEAALEAAERSRRDAETEAGRWRARAEALALTLDEAHLAADADLHGIDGVIGPVIDHLEIEAGTEAAVAAALGDALRALAVEGGAAARAAVERAERGDGQALLLVVNVAGVAAQITGDAASAPLGTRPLADCVRGTTATLDTALRRLLAGAVLVEGDWTAAIDVALATPGLVAVTREGHRFGGAAPWHAGRPGPGPATRAVLDEARVRADEADAERVTAEATAGAARARVTDARRVEQEAAEERRARRSAFDNAREEAATLRHDLELRAAGIDERRAFLARRLAEVETRLASRPDEQAAAHARRTGLTRRRQETERVGELLAGHAQRTGTLAERLRRQRRKRSEAAREAGRRLDTLRADRVAAERDLTESRERASRLEIDETETRLRLEGAVEAVRRDFDCEPEAAIDAPAPEPPEGTTLPGRARELERELRILGPVNPLALGEYEALLERHEFLQAQLDDVKSSRRELARVIRAVDAEIVRVFDEAFGDVAAHFEQLFTTLFPGGSGRLVLSDPANLLDTGVEIEARPSGKNVRRLSLLSGGERSLTALAYLFAVFRARPSPFYLLDEVEAALDDVNLHRFLDLIHEFRDEAQLVVVSHQKRTMEAADALYGVSMPPGGSSRVVSQRMRDLTFEDV